VLEQNGFGGGGIIPSVSQQKEKKHKVHYSCDCDQLEWLTNDILTFALLFQLDVMHTYIFTYIHTYVCKYVGMHFDLTLFWPRL